jgi:hypothetical protein
MEQVKTRSVEPQTRSVLSETTWEDLSEAGAYVERGSGDLYRVAKEALIPGSSPIIHKESLGASRLLQISKNPFVTSLEARLHGPSRVATQASFCISPAFPGPRNRPPW